LLFDQAGGAVVGGGLRFEPKFGHVQDLCGMSGRGLLVHLLKFQPLELVEQFAGDLPVFDPGFDFCAFFVGHFFMLAQGEGFAKCGGGLAAEGAGL
jgi:hypothetical protein